MDVERLIALRRWQVKVSGFPTPRQSWQLVALLVREGGVIVEFAAAPSYAVPRADGVWVVTVDERLSEDEQLNVALEEVGHVETDAGTALPSFTLRNTDQSRRRFLLLQDDREENAADRYVLAWKLPLEVIRPYEDDEALRRDSGCSLEEIGRRWKMLGRRTGNP